MGEGVLPRWDLEGAYLRLEVPLPGCPQALPLLRSCLSAWKSEPSLWRGRQDAQEKCSWEGRTRWGWGGVMRLRVLGTLG